MESHEEQIKCPECGQIQTAVVLHTFPWWSYIHECEKCKYIIMESEWDVVDVAGAVSRSSFLQYLKNLIEIHGEQMFGIYETTTETTNGDQKVTLCCWGCDAKG